MTDSQTPPLSVATSWNTPGSVAWRPYVDQEPPYTVVGMLLERSVWSPQLMNWRDVLVWLPDDYTHGTRRYPVIYMQDGQNLFDERRSHSGEWQVDETMHLLGGEGLAAIIVGVPNMGAQRIQEYGPFPDPRFGLSRSERYLDWLTDTLKPLIDRDFRTIPERESTGIAGSSMGGLISLYAFVRRTATFGFVAAFSPSLWFVNAAILPLLTAAPPTGRIYLDTGNREGPPGMLAQLAPDEPSRMTLLAREAVAILERSGYRTGDNVCYVEDWEGRHHESDWARRLPNALRFLLCH